MGSVALQPRKTILMNKLAGTHRQKDRFMRLTALMGEVLLPKGGADGNSGMTVIRLI
jgi:hypothetical protein